MIHAEIERHYARDGLVEAIRDGLWKLGKDLDRLTPEDLAPVDEFHIRGRAATLDLARQLELGRDSLVLDIGAGLGGPSRALAAQFGCRVIGIDLTESYCQVATTLTHWVGLAGRCSYRHANALDLPFADYQFDAAWTLHAAMNIADKATLYGEAFRTLKPGGQFALYDVLQGPGGAIHLPVPWARQAAHSHLVTADALRPLLEDAGFEIIFWQDATEAGRAWFAETARRSAAAAPPPLGMSLLLGDDFPAMAANLRRNLDEGRVALVMARCRRPG